MAITEKGDYNQYYHGEGVGDINGDGAPDVLTAMKLGTFVFLTQRGKDSPWLRRPASVPCSIALTVAQPS